MGLGNILNPLVILILQSEGRTSGPEIEPKKDNFYMAYTELDLHFVLHVISSYLFYGNFFYSFISV